MCSAEVAAGALLPLALPYKQLVVVMVLLFPLNALDLLRAIECAQDKAKRASSKRPARRHSFVQSARGGVKVSFFENSKL
jgi:hypothetical protein